MKFRKDINGLRAIAVIAVVLFHFNASWMPGGFAGVDVFFVISGFLMTGIIFRGIEQENFSILKFYVARANRIIPALAVLCLVLLVFGWFYLTPLDYRVLGKHVGSSMGFLSNIIYWRESGYFDAASHEKWLLHTWSLSAEWQFYIIYPLVLVAMRKFMSLKAMKATVLVGTVLGFIFCVIATYKWPNPAYYLLPTRAWEMMIGGVAYLYPLKLAENRKKVFEWVGLALIILSYIFISKENLWPGYLALMPVFGAFLLIQAQRNDSFATGNIIFQSLGKWSYSIYLWHWPLVVAIYYFYLNEQLIYFGIVLSVILGFISNRYIESIKYKSDFNKIFDFLKCKPIYFSMLVGTLGSISYIYMPNSYLNPMPQTVLDSLERGKYECFDKGYQHLSTNDFCKLSIGDKKLFAFGDSHSYSSLPVVESVAKENHLDLTYTGYSGCVPLLNVYPKRSDQDAKNCKYLNDKVFEYIEDENIDFVFLAARWTYYTSGEYNGNNIQLISNKPNGDFNKEMSISVFKLSVAETFKKYDNLGVKLIIMLQVPMQESNPDKLYYKALDHGAVSENKLNASSVKKSKHISFQAMTNKILIKEAEKYNNILIIDPTDIFCNGKTCPVGNKNFSYYFDNDHLSINGSYKIKSEIERSLL